MQQKIYMSKNKNWITRDGIEVPINKMSTDHLLNAIAMLLRNAKNGVVKEDSFMFGGWDCNDFGESMNVLYGKEYLAETKYKELVKELKRRKI